MSTYPAIAVLELASIAVGTQVADAMVKRAPIEAFRVGTVQPGKYLILVGGSVAAVEEAHLEGLRLAGDALTGQILLPHAHEQVVEALDGKRRSNDGDALGVIETSCIPAVVLAADRAVKTAKVAIVEIRLGDGLGGRGITEVTGSLESVEAAMAAGLASIEGVVGESIVTQSVVIPAQHDELRGRVDRSTSFFE
ncbi:MAG: BMC domain-containing protein [bacterium]|nr:BMC domain-containing protein [bacterium]